MKGYRAGSGCAGFLGWTTGLVVAVAPAWAGGAPPDYGYTFVTIGAAGNRATIPSEVPTRPNMQVGAVGYEYRMATTEVTGADWFEFVQAYAPFVGSDWSNPGFWGPANWTGFVGGAPQYAMNAVWNDRPANVSWRYAARYCNWLTNGKALTQAAFENGAYDTSTFTTNPDGTVNDQLGHNAGALYWLPTQSEWVKAAYFDPNRYGVGQEGYWRHPGGQDTPLTGGEPGTPGAQTSATLTGSGFGPVVGAYPDVNAPWGLLDTSGGASEWTESGFNVFIAGGARFTRGSYTGSGSLLYPDLDQIDSSWYDSAINGLNGLRLASAVPSPGSATLALISTMSVFPRRRRS